MAVKALCNPSSNVLLQRWKSSTELFASNNRLVQAVWLLFDEPATQTYKSQRAQTNPRDARRVVNKGERSSVQLRWQHVRLSTCCSKKNPENSAKFRVWYKVPDGYPYLGYIRILLKHNVGYAEGSHCAKNNLICSAMSTDRTPVCDIQTAHTAQAWRRAVKTVVVSNVRVFNACHHHVVKHRTLKNFAVATHNDYVYN